MDDHFWLDAERTLIPESLLSLATRRIAGAFGVPPEYFHMPPESSSASATKQAREEFARKLSTYEIKTIMVTKEELFLLEARRRFSRKIYHNIERRITRHARRIHWLLAPRIYLGGLRISQKLEDDVFRSAYPGGFRRLPDGGELHEHRA